MSATITATRPASPKQVYWIDKTAAERVHEYTAEALELAKADSKIASEVLTVLFAAPYRQAAPTAAPANPVTEEGIYRTADGTLIRARRSKNTGNLYGMVLVITEDDGKHRGTWEYQGGLLRQVTPADRLTEAQAAAIGRQFKFCIVCATELSDPKSVARGIGPVCASRV